MKITITSKQFNIGDSLKAHTEECLEKVVAKYFDNAISASVNYTKEGDFIRADISVHPSAGIKVQGNAKNPDAYTAFDEANIRIAKQLARYKDRLTDHTIKGEPAHISVIKPEEDEVAPKEAPSPMIIAEMDDEIPTCSVSIAVMHMDLADVPALLFRNSANGNLNMVYKRNDGNIGWVDPSV